MNLKKFPKSLRICLVILLILIIVIAVLLGLNFYKSQSDTNDNTLAASNEIPRVQAATGSADPTEAVPSDIQTTVSSENESAAETTVTSTVTKSPPIARQGFQPYILKFANPSLPVYSEPSYDSYVTMIIDDRGSYTIIEETNDSAGNLWGKLQSGDGWIDLIAARSADSNYTGLTETPNDNEDSENYENDTQDYYGDYDDYNYYDDSYNDYYDYGYDDYSYYDYGYNDYGYYDDSYSDYGYYDYSYDDYGYYDYNDYGYDDYSYGW